MLSAAPVERGATLNLGFIAPAVPLGPAQDCTRTTVNSEK